MRRVLGFLLFSFLTAGTAHAHFLMMYTPEIALNEGGTIEFDFVFTHPFDAGHTMDMEKPLEFYMVSKRGENPAKKKDLTDTLKPIDWQSMTNSGKAYEASTKIRSMGDYTFVMVPAPYYEGEEDIYIQQITKLIMNVGGIPGNWNEPLGLPCEIVSMTKPYALWTGQVYRGVVLSDGKPVPGAEIEVEYLNHMPDQKKNRFKKKAKIKAPHDAFTVQTIFADSDGEFSFAVPKEGYWGFAALGVGPVTEHKGKEQSQDAVIWVKAIDIP
jgi:cobalt/nickel transport protein